jgi:hypothetical protein
MLEDGSSVDTFVRLQKSDALQVYVAGHFVVKPIHRQMQNSDTEWKADRKDYMKWMIQYHTVRQIV